MTNTNLIAIIKALQPNQRQEMAVFLASPNFNRGKNAQEIIRLYQVVLEAAPDFSEALLNKNRIRQFVFSDPNVDPARLEKAISDLNKLLRNYALQKQYFSEANEDQLKIDWARWLRTSGLPVASRKVIVKLKSKKEEINTESVEQYHTNLCLEEEYYYLECTHNAFTGDLNIPKVISQLDLYYLNYRMELANRYLLQQKGSQLPELGLVNIPLDYGYEGSNLLQISRKINEILSAATPNVEGVKELLQVLRSSGKALTFHALAQSYAYLRNFCTLLINNGHLEFIPILHEIQKDNLKLQYFSINGELSPNVYLNVVQIATRAKEYKWAKKFTEDYKNLLVGGDEEHFFYRLNLAQCLFAEGRFAEALDQMPDAPSVSHYHQIARRLELKSLFELQSELLFYKIDAFRKFIVRTAPKIIAADYRTMNLNFLNILMQLGQSPLKDKARSEKLLKRIASKKLLADRAWLIEKAKELG